MPSLSSPPSLEPASKIAADKNEHEEETCDVGFREIDSDKDILSLGIRNKIKIVKKGSNYQDSNSYNGVMILDVNENESGSPYIKYYYGCTECDFKSWIYDDTYQHIVQKHLEICVEVEYLKNSDYEEALKALDQLADIMRVSPIFSNFSLEVARETFVKFNSMNQRYFKKLLPKGEPIIIEKADKPKWKNFFEQIGGSD
jgi:hypothetical protein